MAVFSYISVVKFYICVVKLFRFSPTAVSTTIKIQNKLIIFWSLQAHILIKNLQKSGRHRKDELRINR
jgi:hypothetical protein